MTFDYLAQKVKDAAFFRQAQRLFDDPRLQKAFEDGDRKNFEKYLTETLQNITIGTRTNVSIGRTLDDLKTDFYDEYLERKAGKSHRLWPTPFPTLNREIGGLYSSDVYGVLAESGRGKSYLLIAIVDELLRQGANVLVKSYELKAYTWLSRLLSVISAREEAFDNDGQSVGLANNKLLSGRLDVDEETVFTELLDNLTEYYPGRLYLQAKGDADLTRSLNDLDRELSQEPSIDAVVLDPFYGLSDVYGQNANRTKGGAAEQAAARFEWIVGEHDVVGLYAVQAQVEKQRKDDGEEVRELKLPTRDQVKTSKRLLEVASILFAFDNNGDGEALLGVDKGRNGGEGFELSLIALLDVGVLREFPDGSELPF